MNPSIQCPRHRRWQLRPALLLGLILSTLAVFTSANAQNADPLDYFPLHVGDTWEYADGETGRAFYSITVTNDSVVSAGVKLFKYELKYAGSSSVSKGWYRIDSSFQVFDLVSADSLFGYLPYKLDAHIGDTWRVKRTDTITWAQVTDIFATSVFGIPTTAMKVETFTRSNGVDQWEYVSTIAAGFGLMQRKWHPAALDYLTGAIINGHRYGTISDIENAPCAELELRCYPNPCVDYGAIEYALPTAGHVHAAIVDILGCEIARLVDEKQGVGAHHTVFNVAKLPAGAYFIRLDIDGSVQSQPIAVQR